MEYIEYMDISAARMAVRTYWMQENNDWHGSYCMFLIYVFLISLLKYFEIKICQLS